KYTAKFSQLFNDGKPITRSDQISQLDFFIYSAKHHPIVTLLMLLAFIYVILSIFLIIKSRKNIEKKMKICYY
ncbi:DUF4306 domain-containing protein, partial [Bacillus haynesii]|uniref:DUF4306 domain-containing protein n=1 Tax=Bacillus haynesii TaxID=1925021 RepID=UPI0022805D86